MKTAQVLGLEWYMTEDIYQWHTRQESQEIGPGSIWHWHPEISSEMRSFMYVCTEREPKTFIDIGAHCGIFSSVYCKLVDSHKCYSIEPIREHMQRLEITAKLNNWNLNTFPIGLSNKITKRYYHNTHMAMFVDSAEYQVPEELVNNNPKNNIINEVDILTLDAFTAQQGIRPDLIKLDVEGYEIPILQEAQKTLKESKADLFIETHRDECKQLGWQIDTICDYLQPEDYVFYTIDLKTEIGDLKSYVLDGKSNMRFIAIHRNSLK